MPSYEHDWKPAIRERLARLPADGAWQEHVIEEFEQHLEDCYRELCASGVPEEVARRRALEELETSERLTEELRKMRYPAARPPAVLGDSGGNLMDSLWRDVRYAIRAIRSTPGFALMAIGMLAVGIAGNAAIFSIFDGLFLRPLPFAHSERLVDIDETAPKWNLKFVGVSNPDFFAWREGNQTFEKMAFFDTGGGTMVISGGDAERVSAALVTRDLLDVLSLKPALGRNFTADEDKPKGPKVTMLSHKLWQRRFAGDPKVLGRILKVDGEAYTVVGVLPQDAVFPSNVDLWSPLQADPKNQGSWYLNGVGRLKPGVTIQQAQADLTRIHKGMIEGEKNSVNNITSPVLMPLRDRYLGDYRDATNILLAGVGVVLLIACVNIAGLMLVRGTARAREIAIRAAIGASRSAIVRQLLTESLVLAALGCLLGVFLGNVALRGMLTLLPDDTPQWLTFGMDWRFLVFCAALTAASAVIFGLGPAVQAARLQPRASLQEGQSSFSRARRNALGALIVGEVGLSLLLLVSAGLLVQAFRQVMKVDPGFRPQNLLTFRVWLPSAEYSKPEQRQQFFQTLLERLQALPGVQSASAVSIVPFDGHSGTFYEAVGGRVLGPNEKNPVVLYLYAWPTYFDTMGLTFLSGRSFQEEEKNRVVVNESFAKFFFPNVDPLGRSIQCSCMKKGDTLEIVGVTRDVKHYGLDQEMRPSVFNPYAQRPRDSMVLVMRTGVEPHSLISAARDTLRGLNPELAMAQPRTMVERMDRSLWARRAYSWLFGAFAIVAMVLAAAGIYGVTSYVVSRRTREIGIRIALGALPGQILGWVLRSGMGLVTLGVTLGLAGAFATSRFLETLLFGVKPRDPGIYVAVICGVIFVGLLANLIPARRAAALDPMRTLRAE